MSDRTPHALPVLPPVPLEQVPPWNFYYLNTCGGVRDPTIVWGTDVECDGLRDYLRRTNETADAIVTPAHVLVAATAVALRRHPEFNRRVIAERVYPYKDVNVLLGFRRGQPVETDLMLFEQADRMSPAEIAAEAWRNGRIAAAGGAVVENPPIAWVPRRVMALLQPWHVRIVNRWNLRALPYTRRQRIASTLVNYLGFKGSPPLRSYKPSRLPYDSVMIAVTMGAAEPRPVVVGGEVVVRSVAPLFVRADHRIADAYELGLFTETIRRGIADPDSIEPPPQTRDRQDAAATPPPREPSTAT